MGSYLNVFFIFLVLSINTMLASVENSSNKYTLSGYIKDKESNEELIGATVKIKNLSGVGVITDLLGFYSIKLEPGKYTVVYSFIGYTNIEKEINLQKNTKQDIFMTPESLEIEGIEITAKKENENITNNEMSVIKLDAKTIQKIPALMGEVDVIKAIQLLPGVQSAGEGNSGFSVRGGSRDQNLIILDEATIYNASHLMGFFSVFNNDAIKELKLYKGDIPADYGGRLSSLLRVDTKEGEVKKLTGTGGIGTISSRLTIESPIIKDKWGFMVSGRRSYADLFLPLAKNEDLHDNKLFFYDLNFKTNFKLNKKNKLYLSNYTGKDVLQFGSTDPFRILWGNQTTSLRWNHIFSDKSYSNISYIRSKYSYELGSDEDIQGFVWLSNIETNSIRADFGYLLNKKNTIKYGLMTSYHKFEPGIIKGVGDETIFNELKIPNSNAIDYSLFIKNEQKITNIFTINYGLRFSSFNSIGEATVYNFDKEYNALDSTVYGKNEKYNTYYGIEPRINFNYLLSEKSSIKGSYSRTKQYLHLASNATAGSPLDIWVPSSPNIKPQLADQIALGYFRNFKSNTYEASAEVYYKKMYDQIDFKDHAQLFLNPKIEGEFRIGDANSYGLELLIRKQKGKLTGWIGYTLSKTERTIPEINNGKAFPTPYDKPHDISVVLNYEINKRMNLGFTWVYASGSPVTFPTGRFEYMNSINPVYSDRNSYRLPDYHRMDLSLNIDSKKKDIKKFYGSWNFSIYNVYSRKNAYMIRFVSDSENPNETYAEMTYLFPIIPAVTYNFHF